MSRRSNANASSSRESRPSDEHLAFLTRSLSRNDRDLAALIELSRSLRNVKQAILNTCGEGVLLQLGTGRITLAADDGLQGDVPEDGQELCVDFLLRIKLRKKLLNRLARRIGRCANAMDGEDVAPPPAPKYGDLRIHVDEKAVEEFVREWTLREDARIRIQEQRQTLQLGTLTQAETGEQPDAEQQLRENTDPLDDAYRALREFHHAYEKQVNRDTGAVRYSILDENYVPDYQRIQSGSGIGATNRNMTPKEKEAEFQRWQAALLAKIPDQPTFAELGMEHRVFLLEERTKRIQEQADPTSPSSKKLKHNHDDDEEEQELVNEQPDEKTPENTTPKKVNNEEEEREETHDKRQNIIKPISLAAVPSFYEQDLSRIRNIHFELLASSMQEHARRRLEEVTREYNAALQHSNELYERRQRVSNQVNMLAFESRGTLSSVKEKYRLDAAMAQSKWLQRRRDFEHRKLDRCLPSRWGRAPQGTPVTQHYSNRPDAVFAQVSSCLADVVDAVDMIATGQITLEKFNEPLILPPAPDLTGLVDNDRIQQMENAAKAELDTLANQLRASEEERQRAWKKMLKTKAELELPQGGRGRVDLSNYHHVPLPALRHSSTQHIPSQTHTTSTIASYVPSRAPASMSESDSKYSAARVRERIASDGTVAPVTEPKKTKDGLYQRPAGRTRKGMEWDQFRGIWVPRPGYSG